MSKTLLRRNTEYLVVWLPIILLLCSFLIYLLIRMQAHHMQEEQLIIKQENVWNAFKVTHGNLNKDVKGEYDITEGAVTPAHGSEEPRDTIVYYPDKEKSVPFKVLTSELTWNNKNYQVTTYISSTEITHLIIKVFLGEALLFLLLLAAIVVLNRKSSGLLWKPFFSTIQKVNGYDITKNRSLLLPDETGTAEFDELNKVITNLINKVNSAYYNQKQFVENASHEIQTPLAIIHSKLELMIDDPSLTEKNASMLDEITEATNKLSQMNKTLLLLSKIENNQFPEIEPVNLSDLTETILNNLALYYENFPEVVTHIAKDVTIKASRDLL
ncbi:MAG: histidine kinase dimerization/phospho-acceptor domain-containing protein [Ginsengibacter sp.]